MRNLSAVLLLCGLAACQSAGTDIAPASKVEYTGKLPQPSPFKLQRMNDGGPYVHRYTGLVLPERLGALKREDIAISTENADDVAGNYKIPGRQDFVGTAMVFPIWNIVERPLSVSDVPAACEDAYRDAREVARQRLTNPHIVKEEAIAAPRFKDAVFTRVLVYEADGGTNLSDLPIRSELYWQCGIDKVWVVLHRISYLQGVPDADRLTSAVVEGAPKQP
jgi:hypothetical protein